MKIVPRGNADIYPDDYNRHEGIRQIFWTTCVQKNLYQNDKEMIRIPAAKIVRTPEGVMSYLEFLKRMFFILGSYLWTYTLAQIPVGALLDRVGVKWLMRIGTILWSIATLMTAIVGGLGLIILSRLLLGIAEAPAFPGASKATGYWFPIRERGLATSESMCESRQKQLKWLY